MKQLLGTQHQLLQELSVYSFEVIRPNVASNYNGLINYSSSDPSIASFSSRDLTVKSVGTTTLFANIAADNNYNAAQSALIRKASQSIIVEPLPLVSL